MNFLGRTLYISFFNEKMRIVVILLIILQICTTSQQKIALVSVNVAILNNSVSPSRKHFFISFNEVCVTLICSICLEGCALIASVPQLIWFLLILSDMQDIYAKAQFQFDSFVVWRTDVRALKVSVTNLKSIWCVNKPTTAISRFSQFGSVTAVLSNMKNMHCSSLFN